MTLTINEENAHHLTECTICRAAEKRAADAERERDEARLDFEGRKASEEASVRELNEALEACGPWIKSPGGVYRSVDDAIRQIRQVAESEKDNAERLERALSASQDLVRRLREALREYGLRMIAASEHPLLTPEFQRQLDGILPGDAAQVGFSAAMMLWSQANRVAEAALADSPAPPSCPDPLDHHPDDCWCQPCTERLRNPKPPIPEGPKTLLTPQEVRDRFNAVLDKEPLPRPPIPEGAEPVKMRHWTEEPTLCRVCNPSRLDLFNCYCAPEESK